MNPRRNTRRKQGGGGWLERGCLPHRIFARLSRSGGVTTWVFNGHPHLSVQPRTRYLTPPQPSPNIPRFSTVHQSVVTTEKYTTLYVQPNCRSFLLYYRHPRVVTTTTNYLWATLYYVVLYTTLIRDKPVRLSTYDYVLLTKTLNSRPRSGGLSSSIPLLITCAINWLTKVEKGSGEILISRVKTYRQSLVNKWIITTQLSRELRKIFFSGRPPAPQLVLKNDPDKAENKQQYTSLTIVTWPNRFRIIYHHHHHHRRRYKYTCYVWAKHLMQNSIFLPWSLRSYYLHNGFARLHLTSRNGIKNLPSRPFFLPHVRFMQRTHRPRSTYFRRSDTHAPSLTKSLLSKI